MRRIIFAGIAVGCLILGIPTGAQAASPDPQPFHRTSSFTDHDFCGSGQSIDITAKIQGIDFFSPNGKFDFVHISTANGTWTNPDTGAVLLLHFSGKITETVSGDPEGLYTVETSLVGVPQKIRVPGLGVLIIDAGRLVVQQTFSGDELLTDEIIVVTGQTHLEEGEVTCEMFKAALGIA